MSKDWPKLETDEVGHKMIFKTTAPVPEHVKHIRQEVFNPPEGARMWVWAVTVTRAGQVVVDYCDHDPRMMT